MHINVTNALEKKKINWSLFYFISTLLLLLFILIRFIILVLN